jgi:hypothetical protein
MAGRKKTVTRRAKPSRKKNAEESSDENICFVIMQYGGRSDDYYEMIYSPAIAASGLTPRRADDVYKPSAITHDIWILTGQAKIILADLTGKNPNVLYELGLAHALGKPAIMITDAVEEIPFDLRSLRIITYEKDDPFWGDTLNKKIKRAIEEVLASPVTAVLPTFLLQKQADAMKQDLNKLKSTSPSTDAGSMLNVKPRMSREKAMKFIQRSIQKRAPYAFIYGVLRDGGFDEPTAQSIVETAKSEMAQTHTQVEPEDR